MADGFITINSNTLLKQRIRRGSNIDRLQVILSSGELGFTTDTNRLFIGDGSTYGGVEITGTKFHGATADVSTFAPVAVGDMAYDIDQRVLLACTSGNGQLPTDWTAVGGVIINTDGTISIDANNEISLGDAAGSGLTKNLSTNKLEIASDISVDTISKLNGPGTTYLNLPNKLSLGSVNYDFPGYGSNNTFLKLNAGGNLSWEAIGSTANTFVNADIVAVGTIFAFSSTVLPSSRYLRCDGSYQLNTSYPVLCSTLGTSFGALSANGGNTYFKLPDLRGKTPLGYANTNQTDLSGNTRTFTFATSGGLYRNTLTEINIPQHFHYTTSYDGTVSSLQLNLSTERYLSLKGSISSTGSDTGYTLAGKAVTPAYGETSTFGYAASAIQAIDNVAPYLATNYIIKAIPDPIASCSITLAPGITGINSNSPGILITSINPLSGDYQVGLRTITTPATLGYINTDEKGRVTSYDTTSAGNIGTVQPLATPTLHGFSFMNYLSSPITVASSTLGAGTTYLTNIQVYPVIKNAIGASAVPNTSVPSFAKNAIIDYTIDVSTTVNSYLYVAPASHMMTSGTTNPSSRSEYEIFGKVVGDTCGQMIIPLSANANNNNIVFGMRAFQMGLAGVTSYQVRLIGWTL